MAEPTPPPGKPLYLFYGTQTDAVLKARDAAVAQLIPAEFRNENLTEYYPPTPNAKVSLAELYDEIAGDFATVSFIAEAPKCVVVTNPAELYGAAAGGRPARGESKKKKSSKHGDALMEWLERELPATGHSIVIVAFEDEIEQLEIDQTSPLFQLVQRLGHLQGFRASRTKAIFRLEDAILQRRLGDCLEIVREFWASPKGQGPVYNAISRCLRFLMQSGIARERGALSDPAAQAAFFPAVSQFNLFKAHSMVVGKYVGRGPSPYRTVDLIEAYDRLLDVYRAMRPRPDDLYVPDTGGLLEELLIKLMASPRPR